MARRLRFKFTGFEVAWKGVDEWHESTSPHFSISQASSVWLPAVDMCETGNAIYITVELAGVHPSDVAIEYYGGELIVRGSRHRREIDDVKSYYRLEIDYGPFECRIILPHEIDPDGITAKLELGMLHITMPKRRPSQTQPMKVNIKEG